MKTRCLIGLGLLLLLPGVGVPTPARADEAPPSVDRLSPVQSGAGVLVCAPVNAGTDGPMVDFGEGCARWLQLFVGGQGELGQTPLWTPIDFAWRKVKGIHQVKPEQVPDISRLVGVPYLALGEIAGTPEQCRLTYQLWSAEGRKAGEPITLAGDREQIIAELPGMATRLAQLLGARAPKIPAGLGETAEELRLLGSIPWIPGPRVDGDRLRSLEQMALTAVRPEQAPRRAHPAYLGAFLYLVNRGAMRDAKVTPLVGKPLAEALPDNVLVMGEVARQLHWSAPWDLATFPEELLRRQQERFPRNYLVKTAQTYRVRIAGDTAAARVFAGEAARCAPNNTEAWSMLDNVLAELAGKITAGRLLDELTPEETAECEVLYREQLKSARRTVELDPSNGNGWRHVSRAAACTGELKLADQAYWRAMELITPTDFHILWWGLQLYREDLAADPKKLEQIGEMAVTEADRLTSAERISLARAAEHAGIPQVADRMARSDAERQAVQEHRREHQEQQGQLEKKQ